MKIEADSVEAYLDAVPDHQAAALRRLRDTLRHHLPAGFEEVLQYGMPSFVVPHETYPAGYHCDPALPLPFLSYAAQKRHIALYHMGIYTDPALLDWFTAAYAERVPTKLDMGKSCIRFRNPDRIPFDLLGELASRMTPEDWVANYDRTRPA